MPEGPSIVILKELTEQFSGKKVLSVLGNSKMPIDRAKGKVVVSFQSWGKHFLICFRGFTIRIHFLLFGSYRINEQKDTASRLTLQFKNGVIYFYSCSVQIIDEPLDEIYDWSADVMSDYWDPKAARKKLKAKPNMFCCDALLDQNVFAGSGNIIKNEILYRIKVDPLSKVGSLPAKKLTAMINETRTYSFDFLKWKKDFVLKKHWLAHTKKTCIRCHGPIVKEYLGFTNRRTFFVLNARNVMTKIISKSPSMNLNDKGPLAFLNK
ncbi:DNA-formamidopyrimidine glycosylase family protein [Niabella ginsengisoli]|uniref:Endonuclease n=1 Tax=Niabella ginsengisoli TaxID=522298 RepID=A0ABS9SGM8_9BACT|nr:DNA-formamidopyrimidine glycosylase family protein [Niabella ginsengisoli]MCH5597517.1 endonuclease [Niabella ginsengisoli]